VKAVDALIDFTIVAVFVFCSLSAIGGVIMALWSWR